MRYGGAYKSYWPQYVRGILEGNGLPADKAMWVTYSMNKEDIWVARIPVPVEDRETGNVHEVFNDLPDDKELDKWNLFSTVWCPVRIEKYLNEKYLVLRDKDPYDYAKAERIFPESRKVTAEFTLTANPNTKGILHIEFQDKYGNPAIRLVLNSDNLFMLKSGYRMTRITACKPGTEYRVKVEMDVATRFYSVFVNGEKKTTRLFFAPVQALERIVFRTGEVRRFPDADTPTDQDFDVPMGGIPEEEAVYYIKSLHVNASVTGGSILNADTYKHHVDYFNRMEY